MWHGIYQNFYKPNSYKVTKLQDVPNTLLSSFSNTYIFDEKLVKIKRELQGSYNKSNSMKSVSYEFW